MLQQAKRRGFTWSVLSLSLLTVMAGAAVAPALGVIQAYFSDSDPLLVQMIISVPALFIVVTNGCFSKLCSHFGAKTLVIGGLLLYTIGGCAAGCFDHIGMVLLMRALVGVGVGILMPLSTGLLAFYFAPEEQESLMGYASAMNQMGGVIATLLSGLLANISWRASFLVYLIGWISFIGCFCFLPNDKITHELPQGVAKPKAGQIFKENKAYIVGMFLLMTTFFVYPANFAMETVAVGQIPSQYIAVIMAMMDFVAFCGGLLFVRVKLIFGKQMRFCAPSLFLVGYVLLAFVGGWFGILVGSACIGFANGVGIPFLISEASLKLGKAAAVTVMPMISAALYAAQFLSPMILSFCKILLASWLSGPLSYDIAIVLALLFCLWSKTIKSGERQAQKTMRRK